MESYPVWENIIPSAVCVSSREDVAGYIKTVSSAADLHSVFYDSIDDEFLEKSKNCDVVLIDAKDCGADQYNVIRKIRNERAYDAIPVIVLSIINDIYDISYMLSIGINDIITVPGDCGIFISRIKAHVRMKRMYDDLNLQIENLNKELCKSKTINHISMEYANLVENTLYEKIETLNNEDQIRQKDLDKILKDNERFKNEINDLELLCSTLVTHDTVLENDLSSKLENANLLATTDYLTSIYNRSKFYEYLNREVTRSGKDASFSLSLIMFDVDHFKEINDTCGHDVGDWVLKEITRTIKSVLTGDGIFCRWGGEEFMVLLPAFSLEKAEMKAESMRRAVELIKCEYVKKVTCSFGVAAYRLGENEESFLKRVDQTMYMAKESGRNKVISSK